jgi:DNA-binding response OmpR family regulator
MASRILAMAHVFVVEDNDGLRETIASYLQLEDHDVTCFARLDGLHEAVTMRRPDVIILDVMLPDGDGFAFARRLRRSDRTPIVFLTARASESDRIIGFEVGGDDYVVKPFSNRELMLRVRALLRRTEPITDVASQEDFGRWTLGDVTPHVLALDTAGHRLLHDDSPVDLTAAEWKILRHLAANPGIVISRERLLGSCLDYLTDGSERTIDTHVKNIRSKLAKVPWVETVRGFGYRFAGRRSDA